MINTWIWWTVFLPITLPLKCVSISTNLTLRFIVFCISLFWSAICVSTLIMAAILVYVPYIGDKLGQIFLIPTRIDRIPQMPIVKLMLDLLKI